MSRILADKVTNYNNDGPFEAEKGINIPLNQPLQIGGLLGTSGQYLISNGAGVSWEDFPQIFSGNYNDLTNKPLLFSGNYSDLTNKPDILDINISVPQEGDVLLYQSGQWINAVFPTIYTYTLNETLGDNIDYVNLRITDNLNSSSGVILSGGNGLQVSVPEEGVIQFTSPVVSEYDVDIAKDDISSMFLDGTYNGITFTYNTLTKTFDASVDLAEQLIYTLSGSSSGTDIAEISLNTGTTSNGSVTLEGTNGVNIAWNVGESKITFSKTDPAPYVLPAATTTTLGGVIPDSSDFNIDGLGNLTVNFPSGGITLSDLSVGTEGSPSGNGALSYDNGTGQFTYTPPLFSLGDLNGVNIVEPSLEQFLTYNGSNWQNSSVTIPTSITELTDTAINNPLAGDLLQYNGISWFNTPLNIGSASIEDLSNVSSRPNNDSGQILIWSGTNWDPTAAKLQEFDVSGLPTDGQVLVWNSINLLWDPKTISLGVSSLDDLSDVNTLGANISDVLTYNGSSWAPSTMPTVPSNIGDLFDVSSASPSGGYVLTWNNTSSQWEPAPSAASPGSGLTSRTTVSGSTISIADGSSDTLEINGFKSYMLMEIETNDAAWVTLYTDSTSRSNDASRPETTDPTPGSGVIAEVITTGPGAQTVLITPAVMGFNNDPTPGATIYAKVVNKSGVTQTITVNLTVLQLEA